MLWAAGMEIFHSEMIGIEASNQAPVLANPATIIPLAPKNCPMYSVRFYPKRVTIRTVNPPGMTAVTVPTIISEIPIIPWLQL